MLDIKHFFTKVVGVTYRNRDGTRRQTIIKDCQNGEKLVLRCNEDDPEHPDAIMVCRENGQQLGYLNSTFARVVRSRTKEGYRHRVLVEKITGGGRGKSYGCNIVVIEAARGVPNAEMQRYINTKVTSDFVIGCILLGLLVAIIGIVLAVAL